MKAQIVNTLLGLWLMAAPALLDYSKIAADNGHIVGPIVATFSIIAYWEVTRGMRRWNYPFAIWLLAAPWILGYENFVAMVSDMLCGIGILVFASRRGKVASAFGGGWHSLWKKNPEHIQKAEEPSK